MNQQHFAEITLFSFKERFDPATQEHAELLSARMLLSPVPSALIPLSGTVPLGFRPGSMLYKYKQRILPLQKLLLRHVIVEEQTALLYFSSVQCP